MLQHLPHSSPEPLQRVMLCVMWVPQMTSATPSRNSLTKEKHLWGGRYTSSSLAAAPVS